MKKNVSVFCCFTVFFVFYTLNIYGLTVHAPPIVSSKKGYLLVLKSLKIKPHKGRVFLIPKERLLLLRETDKYFIVSTLKRTENFLCKIPKYARYTLWLDRFDDGEISFRTAIETDTYSLNLQKGIELPIKEILNDSYLVYIKLKNHTLAFRVSGANEDFLFKKKSRFDIFKVKQKKKGIDFFEGSWVKKTKINSILKERNQKKAEKLKLSKYLKTLSKLGTIVLKNGEILRGKARGSATNYILFEDNSGLLITVHLNDIMLLPPAIVKMRGEIYDAENLFSKAESLLEKDIGMSFKYAENALDKLELIPDDITYENLNVKRKKISIIDFMKKITVNLAEKNKVLYDYTVFTKKVLEHHLKLNHILVKRKFWINKNQICPDCDMKGYVTCSVCRGKGKILEKCSECIGSGRVVCEICSGTGWKTCPICDGRGFFRKKVSRGGYSFYGTTAYYPVGWKPARIVTNGRMMGYVGPTPIFEPFHNGTSIDINGGERETVEENCWRCGGKGVIKCPKSEKCSRCNGSGMMLIICPECHGKKIEKCKTCHGRGFIGEVQE